MAATQNGAPAYFFAYRLGFLRHSDPIPVIKREKEAEELERSITGEIGGNKASLSFMYKEPEANKEDGGGGGGTHGGSKVSG